MKRRFSKQSAGFPSTGDGNAACHGREGFLRMHAKGVASRNELFTGRFIHRRQNRALGRSLSSSLSGKDRSAGKDKERNNQGNRGRRRIAVLSPSPH